MAPETPPPSRTAAALIDELRQATTLNVVIPVETPAGRNWAPHRYTPSTVLGRVDGVKDWSLPKCPSNVVLTPDAPCLVLTGRIGTNGPCDIYRASLRTTSGAEEDSPGLVAKFLDLSHFPVIGRRSTQRSVATFCASEVISFNVLAPLQGTHVPHFGGLFGSGTLYCMVFEDGGRMLNGQERRDKRIQEEIMNVLKEIHATGVAAGLQNWMRICRGPDGHIKIVDFQDDRSIVDVFFQSAPNIYDAQVTQGDTEEDAAKDSDKDGDDSASDSTSSDVTAEEMLAAYCEEAIEITKEFFQFGPTRTIG